MLAPINLAAQNKMVNADSTLSNYYLGLRIYSTFDGDLTFMYHYSKMNISACILYGPYFSFRYHEKSPNSAPDYLVLKNPEFSRLQFHGIGINCHQIWHVKRSFDDYFGVELQYKTYKGLYEIQPVPMPPNPVQFTKTLLNLVTGYGINLTISKHFFFNTDILVGISFNSDTVKGTTTSWKKKLFYYQARIGLFYEI